MSYLVLARKYRPQNFAQMVGQAHVVQALSNALNSQRLHHAYLFTGTRGVGKTTVARILAKSLNCTGPDGQGGITAEPCGQCAACRAIDAGRFVDYTELDAASNRGVDEVQALLEQAVYKPVQGRFKVFMIDEVHMLTGHAFNAILKTLEEPPEYLKFVLATTDPQKVPVTVLSRCLQFNLRPMPPATVQQHLAVVLRAEGIAYDDGALRLLGRAARGSMRDALSLTDQAIAFGAGHLQERTLRQMLGAVERGHALRLIEALAAGDGASVVQTVDELRLQGYAAAAALEEMLTLLQRMAVWQAVHGCAESDDAADVADVSRLAGLLAPDLTQLLYSLCLHGRSELGLAPDEYAALTMVLLRLLAFWPPDAPKRRLDPDSTPAVPEPAPATAPAAAPSPVVPSAAAASEPAALTSDVSASHAALAGSSASDAPPDAAPDTQPDATPDAADLHERWHALVQTLLGREAISGLTRELALQSQWVRCDAGAWTLRVAQASLAQPSTSERLLLALQQLGQPLQHLKLELGAVADSPAQRLAAAQAERHQTALSVVQQDPYVQSLEQMFGGKIISASVQTL